MSQDRSGTMNLVVLVGKLGQDIELHYFASGSAYANLSIATNHAVKKNDEWTTETEWHKVSVFGKTAEILAQYAKKGTTVGVKGSIHTRSWDDNGTKRYMTEIKAESVQLLGGKQSDSTVAENAQVDNSEPVDDLPF